MSVRREPGMILVEGRLQERNRLLLPRHRQHRQISLGLLTKIDVEDEAAISRPVAEPFPLVGLKQQLVVTRTARRLLEKISRPVAVRNECDAAAIRRPDGKEIVSGVEAQARWSAARNIQ